MQPHHLKVKDLCIGMAKSHIGPDPEQRVIIQKIRGRDEGGVRMRGCITNIHHVVTHEHIPNTINDDNVRRSALQRNIS